MSPLLRRVRPAEGRGRPTPGLGRVLALDIPLGLLLGLVTLMAAHMQAGDPSGPPEWGPPGAPGGMREGPPWADKGGFEPFSPLSPFSYLGAAALAACVMLRRIRPRLAFVAGVLVATGFLAFGYSVAVPALMVLVYTIAASYALREWTPWALVLLVPLFLVVFLGGPYVGLVAGELLLLAPAAVGVMVRSGRVNAARERDQELRRATYEERLRIAREVHDVVGHSLSVINMQAGVALHVFRKRPEQAEPSLEAIRRTSKEALEELRGTLAVFREHSGGREADVDATTDAGSPSGREPLPGLDRLDGLVERIEAAGGTATVRTDGAPVTLPTAVDQAAYRIVQESLTNVVRHAGGAGATVRISYRPSEIVVEITDNGTGRAGEPPAEGSGIAGMRERARAVGGTLTAGPRPEGGFAVRAELPLGTQRGGR